MVAIMDTRKVMEVRIDEDDTGDTEDGREQTHDDYDDDDDGDDGDNEDDTRTPPWQQRREDINRGGAEPWA